MATQIQCKHRWKIPEPDGREMLQAVCYYCGEVKYMPSAFDERKYFGHKL